MKATFTSVSEPAIAAAALPRRAKAIHRMRPDIHQAFDLATEKGRLDLYWWYYLHGFREMWLDFDLSEDLKGPVNAPVDGLPVHGAVPVTWLMRQFWRSGTVPATLRTDRSNEGRWRATLKRLIGHTHEPLSPRQQHSLIAWYFCCGLQEANLLNLITAEQAASLIADPAGAGVPQIVEMAYFMAPDMHAAYPTVGDERWHDWCATEGQRRFRVLATPAIRQALFSDAAPEMGGTHAIVAGDSAGVNVIGHASGRSGVGEDVRMAARALEAACIPFVVRDIQPSSGMAAEELCLAAHLAHESPFLVNLFCMAGMETVTMLASQRDLLDGRINIGFWPWELAEWPELWSHAPGLMHELWASTEFTAQAYRHATDIPVRVMPMAVAVDRSDGLGRRDFALPEDRFLFCFAFDGHSSFSRKNPADCIAAFCQAFPLGTEPVGLVLKGLRVDDHSAWRDLEARAEADPRIQFISASLTRGALLDLYRSIDCFVSLHRSEGFGRNIAECMLLGKPVIATDYSGNVDFTRADTAALVDIDMREVREGEYPFGTGQVWAAPSVDHAARQMRRMIVDEAWRSRLADAGQMFIETHYAPAAVGEKFRLQLQAALHAYDNKERGR